jgi:hypothetical protein
MRAVEREARARSPLEGLDEADAEFVVRLVLASGSLKELARAYGVSYPTIRGRLDRVIARLREILEGRRADPMSEHLAALVERGELTVPGARSIQELHRRLAGEREA